LGREEREKENKIKGSPNNCFGKLGRRVFPPTTEGKLDHLRGACQNEELRFRKRKRREKRKTKKEEREKIHND
jgi:hypothetical protein